MSKIIQEPKLDFDDVLIVPQRSTLTSRSEIELEKTFNFYHSPRTWTGIPIMCANMSFCSFDMAKALARHKIIACLHKYHTADQLTDYFNQYPENIDYSFVSIGYKKSDLNHLLELKNILNKQPNICIDVPNGHMDVFVKYCKKVRENFPESIIVAGNVTNTSSTQELLIYGGVDIVKAGIGGGSACTTRFATGCGIPQLSCCLENSYVAHGLQNGPKKLGLICSDGGHKNSGDVCKALCAGADFVMLGGYFAGCDESEGEWEYEYRTAIVDNDGKTLQEWWQPIDPGYHLLSEKRKKSLKFYGMSSKEAMDKHNGGVANYRTSEGRCVTIPYKGTTEDTIKDILGGIRSACTYIGADKIKDFGKKTTFIRVNDTHNRIFA